MQIGSKIWDKTDAHKKSRYSWGKCPQIIVSGQKFSYFVSLAFVCLKNCEQKGNAANVSCNFQASTELDKISSFSYLLNKILRLNK